MIDTKVQFHTEIIVKASVEQAFAFVADIAGCASHYPTLDHIDLVDDAGRFRWHMREKGVGPVKMRVIYDAVYTVDAHKRCVEWAPPPEGGGNMECWGKWQIMERGGGGATLKYDSTTIIHVPAPRIMRKAADKVANAELSKYLKIYVEAVAAALDSP
jgi:hypothetical protein